MRPLTRTFSLACTLLAMLSCAGSIHADESAIGEFTLRQQGVDANDPAALMDLADWAERNRLPWQAIAVYLRVLDLRPDHADAYDRVSKLGDTQRLADEPQRQQQLVAELGKWGPNFRVYASPHFIIVYNTDDKFARNRGVLLEKTHHTFFDAFRRADLRPRPLTERLVCVLFQEQADFRKYAAQVDHNFADWSTGYYSAKTNRIAFYNDTSNPEFAQHKLRIAELERQIEQIADRLNEHAVRRNNALTMQLNADRRKLVADKRFLENRIESLANLSNAAKTTHEATHQLAFNTGIQLVTVHYPFWIAEGLATNFEAADPAANFGPYHENPDRSGRLKQAVQARLTIPLDRFVVLTGDALPQNADEVRVAYAQAWGLFNFLFKMRHEQMRSYLRTLASLPPGRRTPDQLRKTFDDAFGPMKTLEDEWSAWLRRL